MALRRLVTLAACLAVAASAALNAGESFSSSSSELPPAIINKLSSYYVDTNSNNTALVEVYAGDFINILGNPLTNHPVKVYINTYDDEKGQLMATDSTGYLRMQIGVGSRVFITCFAGSGFHETTTPIVTVPAEGLSGLFGRIVLQVPSDLVFGLFSISIGRKLPAGTCPVVVTITQYNVTYNTAPQGWDGVEATVLPASAAVGDARPYYFGMFPNHKTNPLPNNRTTTSPDGGVVFPAIPVDTEKDYVIGAQYKDYKFTTSTIRCMRSGQFINAAPNQGPKALSLITE